MAGFNKYPYPSECGNLSLNFTLQDNRNVIDGFNITCDGEVHKFVHDKSSSPSSNARFHEDIKEKNRFTLVALWLYISVFVSFFLSKLLGGLLSKYKWYKKWLPKANAEGVIIKQKNKLYKKFLPKDILEKVIVIPSFSNVELNYKTKGEFSDYLERIKIRDFKKGKIKISSGKQRKVKGVTWYAIFYFKQKPKNGFLEVIYQ
jgi:hypothetical protein